MNATAKDLRFHSKELLETVKQGEEVLITYHGKPCAKLVPLDTKEKRGKPQDQDAFFGIWKDHEEIKNVDKYIKALRVQKLFL